MAETTDYNIAWLTVAGAGLLAFAFWCLLTRGIRRGSVRWALRLLAGVFMVVPAPVPGYDGQYAPAFIVALFEAVFQKEGNPQTAFAVLVASGLLVLVVVTAVALLRWRRARSRPATPDSQPAGSGAPAR